MTKAAWWAVEDDFRSAAAHFGQAARLFAEAEFDGPKQIAYMHSMAFMHAMQSGHTSMENGLLRILAMLGESPPQGPRWHALLLTQACRPDDDRGPILPADVCRHAQTTRSFRNLAARGYDSFDPDRAAAAADSARFIAARLDECLREFRVRIDPPENDDAGSGPGVRSA